ncbi:hypothetical protein CHELA1G2_40058 [Hyphomicrobiales bacterium]|nr:hypothetical protein CHELA1G2_40058 [Hyphomicrobiales bacterium]
MTVSKDIHTDSQLRPLNQRKTALFGGVPFAKIQRQATSHACRPPIRQAA